MFWVGILSSMSKGVCCCNHDERDQLNFLGLFKLFGLEGNTGLCSLTL